MKRITIAGQLIEILDIEDSAMSLVKDKKDAYKPHNAGAISVCWNS
jgi:hypothetical protein